MDSFIIERRGKWLLASSLTITYAWALRGDNLLWTWIWIAACHKLVIGLPAIWYWCSHNFRTQISSSTQKYMRPAHCPWDNLYNMRRSRVMNTASKLYYWPSFMHCHDQLGIRLDKTTSHWHTFCVQMALSHTTTGTNTIMSKQLISSCSGYPFHHLYSVETACI